MLISNSVADIWNPFNDCGKITIKSFDATCRLYNVSKFGIQFDRTERKARRIKHLLHVNNKFSFEFKYF